MNFELITKHITPRFVIDVGARVGDWTREAKTHWPEAEFLLVEANEECRPALEESGFHYLIAALSDREKEVDFYTMRDCGTATGASYYRERTEFFEGDKAKVTKLRTGTLDGAWDRIVAVRNPEPMLLKLDTQGSELDILRGGEKVLARCAAAVVEVSHTEYNEGGCTAAEVAQFMGEHGFGFADSEILGEIVHPVERNVIQSDVLFLKI